MTNTDLVYRQAAQSRPIYDVEAEPLVLRAKEGDRRALDELTDRYMRLIVTIARGFVSAENQFDDLVQEGALMLMQCVSRYTPGRSFGRYLTTALRNGFRNLVRQDGMRTRGWVGSIDSDEEDIPEPADERAEQAAEELVAWRQPRVEAVQEMERGVDPRDAFIVKLVAGATTGRTVNAAMVAAILGVSQPEAEAVVREAKERCRSACERASV